jgi:hypothetical protein
MKATARKPNISTKNASLALPTGRLSPRTRPRHFPRLTQENNAGSRERRLAPNPTSRRDHSDLMQFHFFDQK